MIKIKKKKTERKKTTEKIVFLYIILENKRKRTEKYINKASKPKIIVREYVVKVFVCSNYNFNARSLKLIFKVNTFFLFFLIFCYSFFFFEVKSY